MMKEKANRHSNIFYLFLIEGHSLNEGNIVKL